MLSIDYSEASQEEVGLRALRSNSMQVDLPVLQHSTTLNVEDLRYGARLMLAGASSRGSTHREGLSQRALGAQLASTYLARWSTATC